MKIESSLGWLSPRYTIKYYNNNVRRSRGNKQNHWQASSFLYKYHKLFGLGRIQKHTDYFFKKNNKTD